MLGHHHCRVFCGPHAWYSVSFVSSFPSGELSFGLSLGTAAVSVRILSILNSRPTWNSIVDSHEKAEVIPVRKLGNCYKLCLYYSCTSNIFPTLIISYPKPMVSRMSIRFIILHGTHSKRHSQSYVPKTCQLSQSSAVRS